MLELEGYCLKSSLAVEKDGKLFLGLNRVILLEKIGESGSVANAARSLGISHRQAWSWVISMNKLSPKPLVEKLAGPGGKIFTRLTAAGQETVTEYWDIHNRFSTLVKQLG
jgi:molybdate transport system regulatory protein